MGQTIRRKIGKISKQLCAIGCVVGVLGQSVTYANDMGIMMPAQLISPADEIIRTPETVEAFEKVLDQMLNNKQLVVTLHYTHEKSIEEYKPIWLNSYTAFEMMFRKYPEHFSYINHIQIKYRVLEERIEVDLVLTPNVYQEGDGWLLKEGFEGEVTRIIEELFEANVLNEMMTQKEMAYELYKYVATYLEYDETKQLVSYTGYGATAYQKAVCQGYVSLYNALCKRVGIECIGIVGTVTGIEGLHTWTVARLDGEYVHIDPTFADPLPNRAGRYLEKYFAIDEEVLKASHVWDNTQVEHFKASHLTNENSKRSETIQMIQLEESSF